LGCGTAAAVVLAATPVADAAAELSQ